jgi:hypothetical protein
MAAGELVGTTAHSVPEVAKELYWHLAEPLFDPKFAQLYAKWLQDTFEAGFVISQAETWAELDREEALRLIDQALRTFVAERDPDEDPEVLVNDAEYRLRNIAYGIVSSSPSFSNLSGYLDEQPSYERSLIVGGVMLEGFRESGAIKRRHRDKVGGYLSLSHHLGVIVGLLDMLGELPATIPPRL